MGTTTLENLVYINCPLKKAYVQLIPETIQEAHKIQRQRRKDNFQAPYSGEKFITGDGFVYTVEKSQVVLYFTNTALNPVFKQENIADAANQIRKTGSYKVKADDFLLIQREAAKKNGRAKRYAVSNLKLTEFDDKWGFYDINTVEFNKLNETQRDFAEQIYGKEKQFGKAMRYMRKASIDGLRIYVLKPK